MNEAKCMCPSISLSYSNITLDHRCPKLTSQEKAKDYFMNASKNRNNSVGTIRQAQNGRNHQKQQIMDMPGVRNFYQSYV